MSEVRGRLKDLDEIEALAKANRRDVENLKSENQRNKDVYQQLYKRLDEIDKRYNEYREMTPRN